MELNRPLVWLDEPDMPVAIVFEQASVLDRIHLPRPDHLGAVDISGVVHPLGLRAGVVLGVVANEDEMLAWQTEQFLKLEIGRDAYTVYVDPKIVVEIAFSDIQVSPRYASGLALRFARVKRYRPDKSPQSADTFQTVQALAAAAAA